MRHFAGRADFVVQQADDALLGKALLLSPSCGFADGGLVAGLKDGQAFGQKQDDASELDMLKWASAIVADRAQPRLFGLSDDQVDSLSHASDSHGSRQTLTFRRCQCTRYGA